MLEARLGPSVAALLLAAADDVRSVQLGTDAGPCRELLPVGCDERFLVLRELVRDEISLGQMRAGALQECIGGVIEGQTLSGSLVVLRPGSQLLMLALDAITSVQAGLWAAQALGVAGAEVGAPSGSLQQRRRITPELVAELESGGTLR